MVIASFGRMRVPRFEQVPRISLVYRRVPLIIIISALARRDRAHSARGGRARLLAARSFSTGDDGCIRYVIFVCARTLRGNYTLKRTRTEGKSIYMCTAT